MSKDAKKQADADLKEDEPIEKKKKLGYEYDESDDEEVGDTAEVEVAREMESYKAAARRFPTAVFTVSLK